MKKARLLLVEDEENFGSVLKNYLELSGYSVDLAEDGNVGVSKFKGGNYDLCILDVMMPFKDGFTVAREIRSKNKKVPIIFLTAKGEKEDQLKGYRAGGDDYLTKPFDTEVLLIKLERILERSRGEIRSENEELSIGRFTFNPSTRILAINGAEDRLSPKEGKLLHLLCKYQNSTLPRQIALIEIWNNDDYFATRSMDVYIAKLRKKLNQDPSIEIENIHSSGYLLRINTI
jgi:DNA-binding response OmpR family regulator